MTKLLSILAFTVLTFNGLKAQDAHFSQLYANRLYLNPALTGIETQPELHVQYRNQWPNLSGNFQTANFSYDQKIEKINSGIGAILMYDKMGKSVNNFSLGLNYAYHFSVNNDFNVSAGTQLQYGYKYLDWNKLTFGDMIDPRRGFIYSTGDMRRSNYIGYLDASFGLAVQWKGLFLGGSVHHVNTPDISLMTNESPLPMRYSAHGGYNFNIKFGGEGYERVLTISPHVFYQYQSGFMMLTYGSYFRFQGATIGAFVRRDAGIAIILGYDFNALRLAYSYDYLASKLSNQIWSSHEISLSYRIGADFKARTEKSHQFPTF